MDITVAVGRAARLDLAMIVFVAGTAWESRSRQADRFLFSRVQDSSRAAWAVWLGAASPDWMKKFVRARSRLMGPTPGASKVPSRIAVAFLSKSFRASAEVLVCGLAAAAFSSLAFSSADFSLASPDCSPNLAREFSSDATPRVFRRSAMAARRLVMDWKALVLAARPESMRFPARGCASGSARERRAGREFARAGCRREARGRKWCTRCSRADRRSS